MQRLGMVAAGVASIGGAIVSAVASFGATSPAVAVAFYGTYKAVRETQDAFKKAARSHEKYKTSIENTIQALKEKYDAATPEQLEELTTAGEVKSKVAKELLGFTGQSIKKLEESIVGYDKAVEIAFYAQSRLGKQVGEMEDDAKKLEAYLDELTKSLQGVDEKVRDKLVRKIGQGTLQLKEIRQDSQKILNGAEAAHATLTQAKTESEEWKRIAAEMKANRADWVRHVSKPLKFVSVVAAAASQDYGSAVEQGVTSVVEVAGAVGGAVAKLIDENKKKMKSK
jgi:ABC-type transporter Mla subunit MlaD